MKHISKKRQPVDGLLMILIFSLVFSGLFQVVLAFSNQGVVVPEFLRTLVFARPRGDDQFADCTFSPSLDMSR